MYNPRRDHRFEYIWEAMNFVEDNQCRNDCAFSKLNDPDESKSHAEEYPMCYQMEALFIEEEPIDAIDDVGDEGVVCTLYRSAEVVTQEHPDQGRLFGE